MRMSEIKSLSREEKLKRLEELRLELIKLRTQSALGTLDNPGKIRAIRKTIARILTALREEELQARRRESKK